LDPSGLGGTEAAFLFLLGLEEPSLDGFLGYCSISSIVSGGVSLASAPSLSLYDRSFLSPPWLLPHLFLFSVD